MSSISSRRRAKRRSDARRIFMGFAIGSTRYLDRDQPPDAVYRAAGRVKNLLFLFPPTPPSPLEPDQKISGGVHALIQPFPLFPDSRARPCNPGRTCLTRIIRGPDLNPVNEHIRRIDPFSCRTRIADRSEFRAFAVLDYIRDFAAFRRQFRTYNFAIKIIKR